MDVEDNQVLAEKLIEAYDKWKTDGIYRTMQDNGLCDRGDSAQEEDAERWPEVIDFKYK